MQERCRLDARIDQGTRTGLACVPFFGRGGALAAPANAGDSAFSLQPSAFSSWPWAAGDYAIIIGADDTVYDCQQVLSVVGSVLNLAGNITNTWPGGMVRPLLFGRLTSDSEDALSNWFASVKITLQQLVAERNAQLGITPAQPAGVGVQQIGHTNKIG